MRCAIHTHDVESGLVVADGCPPGPAKEVEKPWASHESASRPFSRNEGSGGVKGRSKARASPSGVAFRSGRWGGGGTAVAIPFGSGVSLPFMVSPEGPGKAPPMVVDCIVTTRRRGLQPIRGTERAVCHTTAKIGKVTPPV